MGLEDDYLNIISAREKQFYALYRKAATSFGLSDCAMWVLYFLYASDTEITQQDLIEMMKFPKQTINSAVTSMGKKGLLELAMIPGTKNKKKITLTDLGIRIVNNTVKKLRSAEERAVLELGVENIRRYIELYDEFYRVIERVFKEEGIGTGKGGLTDGIY